MDINTSLGTNLGGLIPDIGTNSNGVATQPIPGGGSPGVSFKDTVKQLLSDVNDKVNASDTLSRDYAAGRTNDVTKVVTSVEEANLAMSFTLAIRNKLLDAYTEISQMQV